MSTFALNGARIRFLISWTSRIPFRMIARSSVAGFRSSLRRYRPALGDFQKTARFLASRDQIGIHGRRQRVDFFIQNNQGGRKFRLEVRILVQCRRPGFQLRALAFSSRTKRPFISSGLKGSGGGSIDPPLSGKGSAAGGDVAGIPSHSSFRTIAETIGGNRPGVRRHIRWGPAGRSGSGSFRISELLRFPLFRRLLQRGQDFLRFAVIAS